MKKCPKCGQLSADEFRFCNRCGTQLPDTRCCPRCGAEAEQGLRFCTGCGAPLEKTGAAGGGKEVRRIAASLRQGASRVGSACKAAGERLRMAARDAAAHHREKSAPAGRKKYILFGGVGTAALLIVILLLTLGGGRCTETKSITVDGVYADVAYESTDGRIPIYIYLTVRAGDEDLDLHSKYVTLTFDDGSQYDSEFLTSLNAHQEKYLYSEYIKTLYGGETGNLAFAVRVPQSRLDAAKSFTLTASQVPGIEKLRIGTGDVVRLEGDEAVCSKADPEGYAHNMLLREPASDERAQAVETNLTGRCWLVSVGNGSASCTVRFKEGRKFDMTFLGRTNSGTYDIREGYLYCSYDRATYPLQIPYTLDENGKVDLTFADVLL